MSNEQPDTAAIRSEHTEHVYDDYQFGIVRHCQRCGRDSYFPCLPLKMADALDAARAERDDKTKDWYISNRAFRAQWDRAEAAEARIRELEQLADPELDARWCAVWQEVCAENDALEVRIATALFICAEYAYADAPVPISALERALTGSAQ